MMIFSIKLSNNVLPKLIKEVEWLMKEMKDLLVHLSIDLLMKIY